MEIESDQWVEMVMDGAGQLGVRLAEDQARRFARHGALLLEWNRKVNLTAIVDPVEVAVKHFLDAIAPLGHISSEGRLLDIGTGGGFPGIPLKILRPRQHMTLIDSVRKKVNFVRHVIRELGLASIDALHMRAEQLAADKAASGYDVIVCRALSNLEQAVAWAGPLLADGGSIVAYRGPKDARCAPGGPTPSILTFGQETYQAVFHSYDLPMMGDERTVTVLHAAG